MIVVIAVMVVIVVVVPRSLLRVGVIRLSSGRIRASTFLRSSWTTFIARRVEVGDIILRGVCLVGGRATVPATLPTARGCGCWLRWSLTHGVGGDV